MVGLDTASSSNQIVLPDRGRFDRFLRPLNSGGYTSEMATFVANMGTNVANGTTNQNALLTGTVDQTDTTWVNSLTMAAGSTLNMGGANGGTGFASANRGASINSNFGNVPASANTLNLGSSGILVRSGTGMASINGGLLSPYYNNAWSPAGLPGLRQFEPEHDDPGQHRYVDREVGHRHDVDQPAAGDLAAPLFVDAGTLQFNVGGQANPLRVAQSTGWWTTYDLYINGGTLDLNGSSQLVNRLLTDNNGYNDRQMAGGTITNTAGGAAATLTEISNATTNYFGGTITGNLNFTYAGNQTVNDYPTADLHGQDADPGQHPAAHGERQAARHQPADRNQLRGVAGRRQGRGEQRMGSRISPTAPITLRGGSIATYCAEPDVAVQVRHGHPAEG